MKKELLIAVLLLGGMRGYGQEVGKLPKSTAVDDSTYFVSTRDSAGVKVTRKTPATLLARYVDSLYGFRLAIGDNIDGAHADAILVADGFGDLITFGDFTYTDGYLAVGGYITGTDPDGNPGIYMHSDMGDGHAEIDLYNFNSAKGVSIIAYDDLPGIVYVDGGSILSLKVPELMGYGSVEVDMRPVSGVILLDVDTLSGAVATGASVIDSIRAHAQNLQQTVANGGGSNNSITLTFGAGLVVTDGGTNFTKMENQRWLFGNGSGGFNTEMKSRIITQNNTWTWPNRSGIVADSTDVIDSMQNIRGAISTVPVYSLSVTSSSTSGTLGSYAVTTTGKYEVSLSGDVSAVTGQTLGLYIIWTDQNGTSQSAAFYPTGATSELVSMVSPIVTPVITINALTGHSIFIQSNITGVGSITFDAFVSISTKK